jgi:hypothetical protein
MADGNEAVELTKVEQAKTHRYIDQHKEKAVSLIPLESKPPRAKLYEPLGPKMDFGEMIRQENADITSGNIGLILPKE